MQGNLRTNVRLAALSLFVLGLFSLGLFASGLAGSVSAQAEDLLHTMPDNSWVMVESGGLTQTSGIPGRATGILAYSGMAYDSVNQQLLVFGGGHNDYGGNEIWAFDTQALTWEKQYEPDPVSAYVLSNYDYSETGKLQASGRPLARHTYDFVEFIDDAGVMMVYGGRPTTAGATQIPVHTLYDTWTYDYPSKQWTYKNPRPWDIWAGSAAYDESAKLLVAVHQGKTSVYDHVADQWTRRFPAQNPPGSLETALEYDSKREVMYFFGGAYPERLQVFLNRVRCCS